MCIEVIQCGNHPMKHLFLIRHAKSSWDDPALEDRDRPLSKRGRRQVAAMAAPLARLGALDGQVYASNAARARETLEGLLDQSPVPDLVRRVHFRTALYTFSHKDLRKWLRGCDPDQDQVTLIGHNPALLDLAGYLAKTAPEALPTGAMVHIALPITDWRQLGKHQGEIRHQLIPAHASYKLFRKKLPRAPEPGNQPLAKRIPRLLQHQYQRIRALEPGMVADQDPEFLHQYRVTLRRSRALAEAVHDITGKKAVRKAVRPLKRQARNTGELRDLDVFLGTLERWQQPESGNTLRHSGVFGYFAGWRQKARQQVVARLREPRYHKDMARWHDFIGSGKFRNILARIDGDSVRDTLRRRIRHHDGLLEQLTADSPDEDVHRLRKTLKRIRYLAELDAQHFRDMLQHLKQRQKLLGRFQDLHVQIGLLETFARSSQGAAMTEKARTDLEQTLAQLARDKAETRDGILRLEPLRPGAD